MAAKRLVDAPEQISRAGNAGPAADANHVVPPKMQELEFGGHLYVDRHMADKKGGGASE